MPKKRDTVTYSLYKGNKKVYIGTTNNPDGRAQEHKQDGKHFGRMDITSRRMTEEGAKQKESDMLESYRRSHGGRNPRYNKDNDG